jgi:hypothetical protein
MSSSSRQGAVRFKGVLSFASLVSLALALAVVALTACTTATPPQLEIVPDGAHVIAGQSLQLVATRHYSDGTVENVTRVVDWSTSDANALRLSSPEISPGLVLAESVANIVFVTARDPASGVSVTSTFAVDAATLRRIDVNPSPAISLARTQQRQLQAIGTFSDGSTQDITQNVLWSSSNEQVADVSTMQGTRGFVTAIAPGTTTVSATDGLTGVVGSTLVFVNGEAPVLRAIQLIPNPATIVVGTSTQYTATGIYDNGMTEDITTSVTWSSSAPGIATINNQGIATGLIAGQATITATENNTAIRASAELTVMPP